MLEQVLLLAVLLFLSGFFSSAETALYSISKAKARHLIVDGSQTGILIHRMKEDSHKLLTTILIGNNLVNIGSSAIATALSIDYFSNNAVGIATGCMTLIILIFGEIFPKSVATQNNILIARIVIFPVYWLSILFFPLIKLLDFIPMLTGKMKAGPSITEEELITIIEVGEEEGEIREEEKQLIRNIFEFDDISASEIMTPRGDMFVIDVTKQVDLKDILDSGFSRIPVIDGEIDNIVGLVYLTDIFRKQMVCQEDLDFRKIMRKPYFIPEYKKINTLLHQFKKIQQHMAIVVDEHGGVSGLITLEDVLEEIVGDISDETDKKETHIIRVKPNEWLVLGKTEIEEVNKRIGMEIEDSPEYDTFSGYVLDRIGRIPSEKDVLNIDDYSITVKQMDGNRINQFIVIEKNSHETKSQKS